MVLAAPVGALALWLLPGWAGLTVLLIVVAPMFLLLATVVGAFVLYALGVLWYVIGRMAGYYVPGDEPWVIRWVDSWY